MSSTRGNLTDAGRRPLGARSAALVLTATLGPIILIALAYIYWPTTPELPGEEYVVPPNTTVFLGWRDNLTGQEQRAPLDVRPGQSIRILVGGGKTAQRGLDDAFKSALRSSSQPSSEPTTPEELLAQGYGVSVVEQHILPAGGSRFAFRFMKSTSPVPATLRRRERLDEVVASAASELDRFCALMVWVRRQMPEGVPNPYPSFNALEILDMTRAGKTKAFCGQYAQVLVQSLISLGYQARYVGLESHEVVEVWSNEHIKWVVLDPFSCCYYREADVPLSALEVHRWVCQGATDKIEMVRLCPDVTKDRDQQLAQYKTFNISLVNDHPERGRSGLADVAEMWRRRVWWIDECTPALPIDDGKLRLMTPFESDLYFNINTVSARFKPRDGGVVGVALETYTPEFDRFEQSFDARPWQRCGRTFEWHLEPGENALRVRATNAQGVTGPPSSIMLCYTP